MVNIKISCFEKPSARGGYIAGVIATAPDCGANPVPSLCIYGGHHHYLVDANREAQEQGWRLQFVFRLIDRYQEAGSVPLWVSPLYSRFRELANLAKDDAYGLIESGLATANEIDFCFRVLGSRAPKDWATSLNDRSNRLK